MEDIYRRLQKHFDNAPVGFPATDSGVELRILKHLFTEEEARVALELSIIPEDLNKIHKRLKKSSISQDDLKYVLDQMVEKGAIRGIRQEGKASRMKYSRLPLVIGMFEFQVDRITRELAEDFFAYEHEAFAEELNSAPTKQMRTIPLNVNIEPEFHIGSYDRIKEIIQRSPGPFAVMNCICRQSKDKMNEPCKQTHTRETCLTIGNSARYMMQRGVGRLLTKTETKKMITRAKKEGMVLQPENAQNPSFICFCCGCCCGILQAAKKFDKPATFVHSNFYAEINDELCTCCEDCRNICQMEAIYRTNDHMAVDHDRCIGCGLCIPVCSSKASRLIKKDREYIPPVNSNDMYKKIVFNKLGAFGILKFVGKATMGRKV